MSINGMWHPDYFASSDAWRKWRLSYQGGRPFVNEYLRFYSSREDQTDFNNRLAVTPCPALAKSAIQKIQNSIFQRTIDIVRSGGSSRTFLKACNGQLGGVDLKNHTMNSYIGTDILPELLPMQQVGVLVDMPSAVGSTLADVKNTHPYLVTFAVEDIMNWEYSQDSEDCEFEQLLLRETTNRYDPELGLPIRDCETTYQYWYRQDGIVIMEEYSEAGVLLEATPLKLKKIPFVLFEIGQSLMTDIADIQIALLNMNSGDIDFINRANFPFYVEQKDGRDTAEHQKKVGSKGVAGDEKIRVGIAQGRRYPLNTNQPAFINPSSEPLKVSMLKQQEMEKQIKEIVHLTVTGNNQDLEAGLASIGMVLQQGERKIAEYWSAYESSTPSTIRYPETYSLQTESERREEAKELAEQIGTVPSRTFQKEIAKTIAKKLVGTKVSAETLDAIMREVDAADYMTSDAKTVALDVEKGLLSASTASLIRGYSAGEAEKAQEEQAKRAAIIAISQSKAAGFGAARGVPDLGPGATDQSANVEKSTSQDPANNSTREDLTRGGGK